MRIQKQHQMFETTHSEMVNDDVTQELCIPKMNTMACTNLKLLASLKFEYGHKDKQTDGHS